MNDETKKDFDGFLMRHLSYHNYINLFSKVDESPKMATLLRREPERGEMKHLLAISRLLSDDRKEKTVAEWLNFIVAEFDFGKNITTEEMTVAVAGLESEEVKP